MQIERERDRDRQTDRARHKKTDRKTETERDTQNDRQTDKQRKRGREGLGKSLLCLRIIMLKYKKTGRFTQTLQFEKVSQISFSFSQF